MSANGAPWWTCQRPPVIAFRLVAKSGRTWTATVAEAAGRRERRAPGRPWPAPSGSPRPTLPPADPDWLHDTSDDVHP